MEKHPSRQTLMLAIHQPNSPVTQHLARCEDCRHLFELFKAFPVAGEMELRSAPSSWIAKVMAIPQQSGLNGLLNLWLPKLTFDSWSEPMPVGVRSQAVENDRRVCFEIGPYRLDIRAERQGRQWEFTAQLVTDEAFASELYLIVDRRKLHADELGFIHWTSSRPPNKVELAIGEERLTIPELIWTDSHQR